ncbi:hypothetical protein CDO29_05270 [Sinorhizobium meliloti]|nr:hypothetical protein SMRU11_36945 [Sinorhizobium meliloti RU11/001]ASP64047.1 hypothetical protein CDO29_05270 [Sinorhizobium meliloti]
MLVAGKSAASAALKSFQPKDLGWLDSCDRHRNEGEGVRGRNGNFRLRICTPTPDFPHRL